MTDDSRKSVLLVEDEALIALAEKRSLEGFGYRVSTVRSGEAAIEAFERGDGCDIVLMDIDLGPGIDGTDAAAAILAMRDVPVVFLSSHTEPEVVEKTEKITSYGYVVKNSSSTVLDASIKMAFKLFEAKRSEIALKDKLAATISALPDFLAETGPDGLLYESHDPGSVAPVAPSGETAGRRLTDGMPSDAAETVLSALTEAGESGYSFGRQYSLEEPDGIRWYELSVSVKPGSREEPRLIVLRRDVTERRQALEVMQSRVVALTQPLDGGSIEFDDLFDAEEIQLLQDRFSAATGVASIITRPDGVPLTEPSNFTRFCLDIVRRTTKGCANCFKSDATLGRYHPDGPVVSECLSSGLWDAGANIVVGGRHVANWLIGQVRDETQTEERMREYAREIGADEDELVGAFREVPAMPRSRFEEIAGALHTIANQIAFAAFQNVRQAREIARSERAEAELLSQKNLLSAIVESSALSIFAKDLSGRYVMMNAAGARLLGLEVERIIGATDQELHAEATAEEFSRTDRLVIATDSIQEVVETGMVGGSQHSYLVNKAPWKDGSGRIIGITGISNDVTEREREERRVRRLLEEKDDRIAELLRLIPPGSTESPTLRRAR